MREALGRYSDLSSEADIILERGFSDAERAWIVPNMRLAGFRACAPAEAWADPPPGT